MSQGREGSSKGFKRKGAGTQVGVVPTHTVQNRLDNLEKDDKERGDPTVRVNPSDVDPDSDLNGNKKGTNVNNSDDATGNETDNQQEISNIVLKVNEKNCPGKPGCRLSNRGIRQGYHTAPFC